MEATKDGRSLSDFKYVCVGYSAFLDNKGKPSSKGENRAELPFCVGIELLIDRRPSTAGHAPQHAHKEDDAVRPQPLSRSQPQQQKPAPYTGEDLLSRFARNAGLVASGVARNVYRVGNYVKDTLEDIVYPYRRRPK